MTAVEEWVNGKDPDFFSSGLMTLEHRWSKCITLEGNFIEKEEVDLNQNKKSAESDVAPAGIKSYKFLFVLKKIYFAVFKKLIG